MKNNGMTFFGNYKRKSILKLHKQIDEMEEQSGSYLYVKKVINVLFDIISWIIIAVLVYGWWKFSPQMNALNLETAQQACRQIINMGGSCSLPSF